VPVCLLPLPLELGLVDTGAVDQLVKLSLRRWGRLLGHPRNRCHVGVFDPESRKHAGHVPGLHVDLIVVVGQLEHPELAVLELLPGLKDVRQEQGEPAIVVQPPDVDKAVSLLGLELLDTRDHLVVKTVAVSSPEF